MAHTKDDNSDESLLLVPPELLSEEEEALAFPTDMKELRKKVYARARALQRAAYPELYANSTDEIPLTELKLYIFVQAMNEIYEQDE